MGVDGGAGARWKRESACMIGRRVRTKVSQMQQLQPEFLGVAGKHRGDSVQSSPAQLYTVLRTHFTCKEETLFLSLSPQ